MKKIFAVAIVAAMIAVSFAVGISVTVQAGTEFMDDMNVPWAGYGFLPQDVAWDDAGTMAVVVGFNASTGFNTYVYYTGDGAWKEVVNPWTYNQNITSVCWDGVNNRYWIGAEYWGSEPSALMFIPYGTETLNPSEIITTRSIYALASDNWGNPLIADWGFATLYYMDLTNSFSWINIAESGGTNLGSSFIPDMDFNINDGKFYAVGDSGSFQGIMFYTDSTLGMELTASNYFYMDISGFPATRMPFQSIDWNQNSNIALVVGVGIFEYTDPGNWMVIKDVELNEAHANLYKGVSWEPSLGEEAAIVGWIYSSGSYKTNYWRYQPDQEGLLEPEFVSTDIAWCVAYKPPGSPMWPMIPMGSGGVKIMVSMNDQTTRLTANAVFPHLYWVGFNDSGGAGRMDQQVPVDAWYNFTLSGNYSQGWGNCEIEVWAWHDQGNIQAASVYPAEDDQSRNLAFRLQYDVTSGAYALMYPGALEVLVGSAAIVDTLVVNPLGADYHILELPIYLGSQIRWGDGNSFGSGDDIGNDGEYLKNDGLQDIDSWDFQVQIRDAGNPSALESMYGEFGVDETVSIAVTGNPSGNAPPGSGITPLANPSIISYSANTAYWVNMSIPNLYENGLITALDWIDCDDVYAWNSQVNSTAVNTDFFGGYIAMPIVQNTDAYIWADNVGTDIPMAAPNNGTNAAGPDVTNYNAPLWGEDDFTQIDWAVDVQAATPEGVYWGVITFTIDS